MTFLLNAATGFASTQYMQIHYVEERGRQEMDRWLYWGRTSNVQPWCDGMLWPNTRFASGDPTVPMALVGQDWNTPRYASLEMEANGCRVFYRITGVTRDSTGSPLGNCIVKVYRTSDDLYISQATSDTGGYYEVMTPYTGVNHYIVAYKAGSPGTAGSTVNSLLPY